MSLHASDRSRSIAVLDSMLARCPGAIAAMLTSRDGRPFAEKANARTGVDAGRFAAMASSLAALGSGVLRELSAGTLSHVIVEGASGKLVVCCVPKGQSALILAVHAGIDARLGLVLSQAKACAVELSELLAHHHTPAAAAKPAPAAKR